MNAVALPAGLEKFDVALRRLTEQLGVPGKYHATITGFFLLPDRLLDATERAA